MPPRVRQTFVHLIKTFMTANGSLFLCPQGAGDQEEHKILQVNENGKIVLVDTEGLPDSKIKTWNFKTLVGMFRKVIEQSHG